MAATAEQLDQQQSAMSQQQHPAPPDVIVPHNNSAKTPFDNCMAHSSPSSSADATKDCLGGATGGGSQKDTRGVRFAESSQPSGTQDTRQSRSPVAHPKNKVLKRKNTPATLPNVDKIYARDQGSGMDSFMEEEDDLDEDDEEEQVAQAVGGVM